MDRNQWHAGIGDEISFWTRWMQSRGGQWPDDYKHRCDPDAELAPHLKAHLIHVSGIPRVLDVGAGPMTILGKHIDGRRLDLTAVDALADLYDQLPFPPGHPLVRTMKCESERLGDKFEADSFDLTYARNTLDHGYDPVEAILQMIMVTKPGGFIVTEHCVDEAIHAAWTGFHQWNFRIENGDLKISNRVSTVGLRDVIAGRAEIVAVSADSADSELGAACTMRRF